MLLINICFAKMGCKVTGLNSTIYLKAHAPDQRQQWILALANAKTQSRNALVGLPESTSVDSIPPSPTRAANDALASGSKALEHTIQVFVHSSTILVLLRA